ncbi:MAG: tRNA CCA-pyrophosphorylase [archaeon]|nr:tRNA CCA-pyrophosphorylase [archaeon]MCP8314448.1 tRNA CCA-pyrophosphorylase [archaeon]
MGLKVILLTGRSLKQGIGKELSKVSDKYRESVSICEIHSKDADELGLKDGDAMRVTTQFGSIIVKCNPSQNIPTPGIIFIPYGPYASMIIGPDTDSTGMPRFKGVSAEVEPAPEEKVLNVRELLSKYLGR